MYKLPKISIVVVTLNNQRTLEECVKRIKEQDYPKELIEYLNIDGGSTDNTTSILKQYGFIVVKSYIKKEGTGHRKNILYNGTIRVDICNSDLLYKILGWIDGVIDIFDNTNFLFEDDAPIAQQV